MQEKRSIKLSCLSVVPVRLGLALALLTAVLGAWPVLVVRADTFEVDRADDNAAASACTAAPNDCSLRGAITAANTNPGPDTITLGPYTHNLTITGASEDNNATGDLDILAAGGDLTINGVGAGSTIVNGLGIIIVGTDRVFHVDPTGAGGITLSISGVTIQNGYTGSNGGGIYNGGSDTVNITDSTLSDNEAAIVGGTGGGGGIYNTGGGIANITNSTLSENRADCHVGSSEARGGGVYNDSGGSVNITGGTVYSNTATTIGDPGSLAVGGGIYNVGTTTVDGCTISRNTADYGGGICNWTTLTVTNSTIGGTGAANQAISGGGIYNWGTTTVDASTIRANTATGRGGGMCNAVGGIMTVDGCTVSDSTADYGGGIGTLSDEEGANAPCFAAHWRLGTVAQTAY